MKKLIALGYLAVPLALSAMKLMPAIVFTLLFAAGGGLSGAIAAYFGVATPITMATFATVFGYFVSGFFPNSGGIANFIIGL